MKVAVFGIDLETGEMLAKIFSGENCLAESRTYSEEGERKFPNMIFGLIADKEAERADWLRAFPALETTFPETFGEMEDFDECG